MPHYDWGRKSLPISAWLYIIESYSSSLQLIALNYYLLRQLNCWSMRIVAKFTIERVTWNRFFSCLQARPYVPTLFVSFLQSRSYLTPIFDHSLVWISSPSLWAKLLDSYQPEWFIFDDYCLDLLHCLSLFLFTSQTLRFHYCSSFPLSETSSRAQLKLSIVFRPA